MATESVYISVGSNIDPHEHVPQGIARLLAHADPHDVAISSFYVSEAIGRPEQPLYCNGVVKLSTDLSHDVLKEELRGIEALQGRVRVHDRYAPRTLDLDIILYGEHQFEIDTTKIPEPTIQKWSFIYVPLLEITPEICLPGLAEPLARMIPSEHQPPLQKDTSLTEAVYKGLHHE